MSDDTRRVIPTDKAPTSGCKLVGTFEPKLAICSPNTTSAPAAASPLRCVNCSSAIEDLGCTQSGHRSGSASAATRPDHEPRWTWT